MIKDIFLMKFENLFFYIILIVAKFYSRVFKYNINQIYILSSTSSYISDYDIIKKSSEIIASDCSVCCF